ncbi:hypothetical protein AX17_007303 [Amanita inopinata Kibby_2008]|nr:hypothetical protein AX17_007303 [Amanita inopinata Kibby_2008]
MYRVLPASRHVASTSNRGVVRIIRRRLATDSAPEPKKQKRIFSRIFWATTTLAGTFYVGSTFVAFNNQAYYDFFSDQVPLGQSMLEFAEARNWDTITLKDIMDNGNTVFVTTRRFIQDTFSATPTPRETTPDAAAKTAKSTRSMVEKSAEDVNTKTKVSVPEPQKSSEADSKPHTAQEQKSTTTDDVQELIKKAEEALASESPVPTPKEPSTPPAEAAIAEKQDESDVYNVPLPVGFEPPPGYKRPSPPKKVEPKGEEFGTEPKAEPVSLPLVAPAVSSLSETEPMITHLAGTIDNLASYLASNPAAAAKATDILEQAKVELNTLAERIEKVKEEERTVLEAKLDEQTREYSIKLMELEMEAQDKLDSQEDDFRKFFDLERVKMMEAYREKLDHELKTQTELINERLKEEVIAQGIELQRRWIREIKVRVEQERGGRLAKLDELSANLKRLERIAIDNSNILDENIRIHSLWSAIRALSSAALDSPSRKPFRDELRVLRHIAAAREDEIVSTVLDSLETSDVPDIGVEPIADLTTWFSTSVAPKVGHIALVPDQDAGVLSYLASRALSAFRFKRHGFVGGDDVLSVLARAEYHLNEKDLDSAARELNQLKGPAKVLLHDWLEAARRRLEVQQALDVVRAQATFASLLVV